MRTIDQQQLRTQQFNSAIPVYLQQNDATLRSLVMHHINRALVSLLSKDRSEYPIDGVALPGIQLGEDTFAVTVQESVNLLERISGQVDISTHLILIGSELEEIYSIDLSYSSEEGFRLGGELCCE